MTTEITPPAPPVSLFETTARRAWLPPDPLPVAEWGRRYVSLDPTSQFKGRWNPDLTPWLAEPLQCLADNTVRDLVLCGPSQGAKTQPLMVFLMWCIANAPGPAMWATATDDDASRFSKDRLIPTIEGCQPVFELLDATDRYNKTTYEVRFATMPLYIFGANSPSKLHSKPARYVFMDEAGSGDWPTGAMRKLEKRTRTFWNSKRVRFSSPGRVNDEFDESYKLGDQRHWFWKCLAPECGHEQELSWKQLKWDENESTKPGGRWNFGALAATIRYECAKCSHRYYDQPATRRHFLTGHWRVTNPLASPDYVSFQWNALLPTWMRWSDLVTEWITANQQLRDGNPEPLRVFLTETLAEAWHDRVEEADLTTVKARRADYAMGQRWDESKRTILTADVQSDVIYYVARQYSVGHGSRMLECGRVWRLDDLKVKQKELGVADGDTGIDSGYRTPEIYQACLRHGWKAMKGAATEYFNHTVSGKTVRKIWAWSWVDPDIGTALAGRRKLRLCLFANPSAQDRLELFIGGKAAPWEVPRDCPEEFFEHLTAVRLSERIDSRGMTSHQWMKLSGKPDHWRDCEKMNVIAALAAGLV